MQACTFRLRQHHPHTRTMHKMSALRRRTRPTMHANTRGQRGFDENRRPRSVLARAAREGQLRSAAAATAPCSTRRRCASCFHPARRTWAQRGAAVGTIAGTRPGVEFTRPEAEISSQPRRESTRASRSAWPNERHVAVSQRDPLEPSNHCTSLVKFQISLRCWAAQ